MSAAPKVKTKGAALVESAGAKLVLEHPFFAAMYLRLALVEVQQGTFFTDGRRIGFNPAFAEQIGDVDEVLFVLAHEVMHNALCHPYRRGNRDFRLWNDACDYAINAALVDMGLRMPTAKFAEGLLDPKYGTASAEEIYEQLLQQQQAQPKPQPQKAGDKGKGKPQPGGKAAGKGKGDAGGKADAKGETDAGDAGQDEQSGDTDQAGDGEGGGAGQGEQERGKGFDVVLDATDEDGNALSPAEADEQAREWEIAVQTAAMQQIAQGNMPGMLKELIKPAHAKADWRALLGKWMQERCSADYRWDRPNPRYLPGGMYLPAMRDEAMGEMVVAIDTSGSVDSELLRRFLAEVEAQRAAVKPTRLHVLVADAAVQGHWEFEQGEPIDGIECRGRGGTDFRPVFDWVEQQGMQPACLIYLTDMAGTYPEQDPGYPVLWANFAPGSDYWSSRATFGEVVDIAPER